MKTIKTERDDRRKKKKEGNKKEGNQSVEIKLLVPLIMVGCYTHI